MRIEKIDENILYRYKILKFIKIDYDVHFRKSVDRSTDVLLRQMLGTLNPIAQG